MCGFLDFHFAGKAKGTDRTQHDSVLVQCCWRISARQACSTLQGLCLESVVQTNAKRSILEIVGRCAWQQHSVGHKTSCAGEYRLLTDSNSDDRSSNVIPSAVIRKAPRDVPVTCSGHVSAFLFHQDWVGQMYDNVDLLRTNVTIGKSCGVIGDTREVLMIFLSF